MRSLKEFASHINLYYNPVWLIKRQRKKRQITNLLKAVKLSGRFDEERKDWISIFSRMIQASTSINVQYTELLFKGFAEEKLVLLKEATIKDDFSTPVLVCTQKNNIVYLKKFIPYYRELGVKHFVFIDNDSNDDSLSYLREQDDVTLFAAHYSFNGVRKAGWKLQALAHVGLNHWYLWLDSDEFLAYPKMEEVKLGEYIKTMNEKGIINVGGFMLDMYPDYNLFDESENPEEFYEDYCYFDPDGESYKFAEDTLSGGMRGRCLGIYNLRLDKTPLSYCSVNNIPSGNHTTFPPRKGLKDNYGCVLKHYKFLSSEKNKYKELASSNSGYWASSSQVSKYLELEKVSVRDSRSVKYENSKSLEVFPYVKDFLKY